MNISLLDPITPAWERMKDILFRPFDIGKWFALGFGAWLMTLLESSSGGGGAFGNPSSLGNGDVTTWVQDHWVLIITIVSILAVLGILFGTLLLWLSCRGRFIFLNQIITDTTAIKNPWKEYSNQSNRLFMWMLIFGFINLLLILPFIGGGFLIFSPLSAGAPWDLSMTVATAALVTGLLLILVVLTYIWFYVAEFVAPLMWKHKCSPGQAWSLLRTQMRDYPFAFILFPVVRGLIVTVIYFGLLLLILFTCCLAGILMIIPYIGAVFILPITVFLANYNLFFMRQFGPDFDVFADALPPPVEPVE